VPGESVEFNIQPGYDGNAVYDSARDGQLTPTLAMTPAAAFYNLAMLPGWQKWKPTYRYGTITAVDGDLANVTLDAATSTQQGLGVNQESTLSDVPIEYMTCNGSSFEVGDEVLVKFAGQEWSSPIVVGFKDNPAACGFMLKIILGTEIIIYDIENDQIASGIPKDDGTGNAVFPCASTGVIDNWLSGKVTSGSSAVTTYEYTYGYRPEAFSDSPWTDAPEMEPPGWVGCHSRNFTIEDSGSWMGVPWSLVRDIYQENNQIYDEGYIRVGHQTHYIFTDELIVDRIGWGGATRIRSNTSGSPVEYWSIKRIENWYLDKKSLKGKNTGDYGDGMSCSLPSFTSGFRHQREVLKETEHEITCPFTGDIIFVPTMESRWAEFIDEITDGYEGSVTSVECHEVSSYNVEPVFNYVCKGTYGSDENPYMIILTIANGTKRTIEAPCTARGYQYVKNVYFPNDIGGFSCPTTPEELSEYKIPRLPCESVTTTDEVLFNPVCKGLIGADSNGAYFLNPFEDLVESPNLTAAVESFSDLTATNLSVNFIK
jgi:hypothetical protein